MLQLDFTGWFQCRLATDPDAFDHPRGEDGWTFAVAGEPDLDRVIRFHNPVAPRSHGPVPGVRVVAARADGQVVADHPLLNAVVELIDAPVFEGRNGDIATSASEPIVPFHLRIAGGGVTLTGRDPIDLADPNELFRRQPVDFQGNSAEVFQATGVANAAAHRQARRSALQADLGAATDPTVTAALQQRIDELGKGGIRLTSLGFKLTYEFDLRGPNDVQAPGAVPGLPAGGGAWSVRFWMGGWDADALSAFISGTLTVA